MPNLDFRKMLVATDSSAGAEAAFHLARYVSSKSSGFLYIMHVARSSEAAADFEAEVTSRYGTLPEDSAALVTRVGQRPAEAILRFAREEEVELILMGKHGSRTTDRLLTYLGAYGQALGSTCEYVVRTAECPVLLTSPRFVHGSVDVRRILVAIDFSHFTPAAIRLGRELADMFDAEVEYLYVREGAGEVDAGDAPPTNNGLPPGRFSIERGAADRVILDHIRQRGIDLLAIHSHGATGDRRARIGHVAEKLVQAAPCSILTVKSFGRSPVRPDKTDRDIVARLRVRAGIG
ncbi:MAG: universal stress protein [Rhodothermia bacterium]|nr:universal stress protein [Rhodothermia bacterium]